MPGSERTGDPLFGVVVGLYLALLVTPPVVFAVDSLVRPGAAGAYVTAITTAGAVLAVSWLATARLDGLAPRLGATPARWLPGLFPVGYALVGFASLGVAGSIGAVAFFFGLGAMAVGFVLGVMARTRHADAARDGVGIDCEFRAGRPRADRRRIGLVAGVVTVAAGACFAVGLLTDRFLLQSVGQIFIPVGIVWYTSTEPRTYTVSDAGLEQRLPVARRLLSWEQFTGYSRTDDALVLHRSWLPDLRLALADFDDSDAVVDAITGHLPAA